MNSLFTELREFVASRSSTFACGGSVPLDSGSMAVRFDSPNGDIAKAMFPIDDTTKHDKLSLEMLLAACQPASFGYKGKDVVDESYRKATKLDESAFSVNFCPYALGIIDTIAQILLPNAGLNIGTKGVRAELYKLNIYAAPSGFFKAHVDTPRSESQFGSLVVSLPCDHEGGQLDVRHAGHDITFDFGASHKSDTEPSIHWAAFYSDCEHEVREVTKGHRVTLTYNLYYALGSGDLAGNSPAMDTTSLPLYHKIHEALAESSFMPDGGLLGIFCRHAYAHSTNEGIRALPGVLKGSDMAVYSVFRALGLKISVEAVLDYDRERFIEERYSYRDNDEEDDTTDATDLIRNFGDGLQITWLGGSDGDSYRDIVREWNGNMTDVQWLNAPFVENQNIGMVHLAYGNQAEAQWMYTRAALIVKIPSVSLRNGDSQI